MTVHEQGSPTMTDPKPSTTSRPINTVRRVALATGADAAVQRELDKVLEARWRHETETARRFADVSERVYGPLQRLIEQDATARAAVTELKGLYEAERDRQRGARTFDKHTHGGPSLLPILHPGLNFFGLPHDTAKRGPNLGEEAVAADRNSGAFSFSLPPSNTVPRFATAGVGLIVEAGATGVAHIRPVWSYWYEAWSYDMFGWVPIHVEAKARVVVQDVISGAVLNEVEWPICKVTKQALEYGDGYVDSWALGADVFVQAGQRFSITLLGTGMMGIVIGTLKVEMQVPLVIVELS
jgi:hypothetical protein